MRPCESMVTCLNPVAPDRSSCTVLGPKLLPPWVTWDIGSDLNGRSCVCIDLGYRCSIGPPGSIGSTATFTLVSPWQIFAGHKQNITSISKKVASQKIRTSNNIFLVTSNKKYIEIFSEDPSNSCTSGTFSTGTWPLGVQILRRFMASQLTKSCASRFGRSGNAGNETRRRLSTWTAPGVKGGDVHPWKMRKQ